ncbi:MAG: sugar O-acetyltransferase [Bacteroidia bacterium]
MQRKENILRWVFVTVMALLLLPSALLFTGVKQAMELKGDYERYERPALTDTGWFSLSFQESFEKWENQHFGYHDVLVRLHHQIEFSLFDTFYVKNLIVGKEGYLFDYYYVRAANGSDILPDEAVKSLAKKTRVLQDSLKAHGIAFMFLAAPGKGSYHEQYIPEEMRHTNAPKNIQLFEKHMNAYGVQFINGVQWFEKMKDTLPFSLFPKRGIHWGLYGAYLTADSIQKRNALFTGKDLPDYHLKLCWMLEDLETSDWDAEESMNLLFRLSSYPMPYPDYEVKRNDSIPPQKLLVIGDSYFWRLYNVWTPQKIYDPIHFWYYNKQLFIGPDGPKTPLDTNNVWQQLQQYDAVIIMCTDANLSACPWGLVDRVYSEFGIPDQGKVSNAEIKKWESYIRSTPEWMEALKKKSTERKISVDSMIRIDAKYMAEQDTTIY